MKKYLVVIEPITKGVHPPRKIYRSFETKEEAETLIRTWNYPIKEAKIYKEV